MFDRDAGAVLRRAVLRFDPVVSRRRVVVAVENRDHLRHRVVPALRMQGRRVVADDDGAAHVLSQSVVAVVVVSVLVDRTVRREGV